MNKLALLVLLGACHCSSRSAVDDKGIAPEVKGLRVGVSTLDDLNKAFPGLTIAKDKSLGGEGTVEYNGKKAIFANGPGVEANIVDGKIEHLVVTGPGLLDWLVKTMDGMPGSKDCPGNRKMGKSGAGAAAYCAGKDPVVFIEGNRGSDKDELDYHLASH